MADKTPDQEPSIEEILASIRQIISDDDDKPAAAAAPTPAPAPEPEPEPEDDVLELTSPLDEPEEEEEDIEVDFMDNDPPAPSSYADDDADILSDATRAATMASLAKLTGHMPISRTRGYEGTTLEDIVRDLLHPMLREWMDSNLPKTVERLVQKELEKLARRAMDE